MIRPALTIGATFALGVGFVMPSAAIAADDAAVVDSIVAGVLAVLEVEASDELIDDLTAGVSTEILNPALVAEVVAALDSNMDAVALVANSFDTDGDGAITGKDIAALKLTSRENWVALEAVLATHGSNSDDDDADDESSAGEAGGGSTGAGSSGSNPGDDVSTSSPDDSQDDDGESENSDDDESEDSGSEDEGSDDDQDD